MVGALRPPYTATAQQGVVIVRTGICQPEAKCQTKKATVKRNLDDKLKVTDIYLFLSFSRRIVVVYNHNICNKLFIIKLSNSAKRNFVILIW